MKEDGGGEGEGRGRGWGRRPQERARVRVVVVVVREWVGQEWDKRGVGIRARLKLVLRRWVGVSARGGEGGRGRARRERRRGG